MRFSIWQAVQFITADNDRTGQAGTVQGVNPADTEHVAVRWDSNSVTELVAVEDLKAL